MLFDVVVQRMVFRQRFEFEEVEIDAYDVRGGVAFSYVIGERFEQLRLAAAPDAGNHLDVWCAHRACELVHIGVSVYELHGNSYSAIRNKIQ